MPIRRAANDFAAIMRRYLRRIQQAEGDVQLRRSLSVERAATSGDVQMSVANRRRMLRALDDLGAELFPKQEG
jgi:hypothetical protein